MAGMRRAGPLSGHWRAPPEHTQTVIAERITGRLSAIKRLSAEPLSDSGAEERTIPAGQARATHRHQPPNFCPKKWKYFSPQWPRGGAKWIDFSYLKTDNLKEKIYPPQNVNVVDDILNKIWGKKMQRSHISDKKTTKSGRRKKQTC